MLYIILFCLIAAFTLSPEKEYDFLYKDLIHVNTFAYKSSLDDSGKSEGIPRFIQGALFATSYNFDFGIVGDGFFKVTDEKGNFFYTRYGQLTLTLDFKLCIKCNDKTYFLPLEKLPESFLAESLKISRNGKIIINFLTDKNTTMTKEIGIINLYDIKTENIENYDGFVVKTKKEPEKLSEEKSGNFYQNFLETSNASLPSILLRMLFLTEQMDDSQIKCKETKTYILKHLLDTDFQGNLKKKTSENISDSTDLDNYILFLERNYH